MMSLGSFNKAGLVLPDICGNHSFGTVIILYNAGIQNIRFACCVILFQPALRELWATSRYMSYMFFLFLKFHHLYAIVWIGKLTYCPAPERHDGRSDDGAACRTALWKLSPHPFPGSGRIR